MLHAADEVVHGTADSLCDDALDADLGHLQRCFSDVAWVLVTSACKLITSITVLLNYKVIHAPSITFPHMQCPKNRSSGSVKPVPP